MRKHSAINFVIFHVSVKILAFIQASSPVYQIEFRSVDLRGRPTVTADSDHYFRTCCPYVPPHFSKSRKTKLSSSEKSDSY